MYYFWPQEAHKFDANHQITLIFCLIDQTLFHIILGLNNASAYKIKMNWSDACTIWHIEQVAIKYIPLQIWYLISRSIAAQTPTSCLVPHALPSMPRRPPLVLLNTPLLAPLSMFPYIWQSVPSPSLILNYLLLSSLVTSPAALTQFPWLPLRVAWQQSMTPPPLFLQLTL